MSGRRIALFFIRVIRVEYWWYHTLLVVQVAVICVIYYSKMRPMGSLLPLLRCSGFWIGVDTILLQELCITWTVPPDIGWWTYTVVHTQGHEVCSGGMSYCSRLGHNSCPSPWGRSLQGQNLPHLCHGPMFEGRQVAWVLQGSSRHFQTWACGFCLFCIPVLGQYGLLPGVL